MIASASGHCFTRWGNASPMRSTGKSSFLWQNESTRRPRHESALYARTPELRPIVVIERQSRSLRNVLIGLGQRIEDRASARGRKVTPDSKPQCLFYRNLASPRV